MDMESRNLLWEDKEVRFDTPNLLNSLRNGEEILDTIHCIEDSKGNPGETGRLLATNLRILWISLVHKKFNLSIGYGRIATTNTRLVFSKVRGGTAVALYLLATGINTRFEFLFTDISSDTKRKDEGIFENIFEIYQLYQRTYLYRDLKLRGAIVLGGQLIVMPQEQVYSTVTGVWNLSSDQGNLGCFIVTNLRLVWFADDNETFNISLPYLQIANIRLRESKYGPALVVQTCETGGGYVLGFRIDPMERLNEIYKELTSLFTIYADNPNFGVHLELLQKKKRSDVQMENVENFKIDDLDEIDDKQEKEINTKLNAYLADGYLSAEKKSINREPVYCKELGFAMERIREGYQLKDLWDVLPTKLEE